MNKMKTKKYHTVRAVPKSNRKILDRGKINIPNTHTCLVTFLYWYSPLQALQ